MANQNSNNQHETFTLGKNVKGHVENGKIFLEIDATKDFGLSTSGKNHTVASTGGFQTIPGTDVRFNGNFIK